MPFLCRSCDRNHFDGNCGNLPTCSNHSSPGCENKRVEVCYPNYKKKLWLIFLVCFRSKIVVTQSNEDTKSKDAQYDEVKLDNRSNKTLGRAQDPRANGSWLSKLTE